MLLFILLLITGVHLCLWVSFKKDIILNQNIIVANQEIILNLIIRMHPDNRPDFNRLSKLQPEIEDLPN